MGRVGPLGPGIHMLHQLQNSDLTPSWCFNVDLFKKKSHIFFSQGEARYISPSAQQYLVNQTKLSSEGLSLPAGLQYLQSTAVLALVLSVFPRGLCRCQHSRVHFSAPDSFRWPRRLISEAPKHGC